MSISLMSSVNLWCLDIFNTTPLKKEEICWCWHVFHWRPNNFLHYLNNFFSWWPFLIMACYITAWKVSKTYAVSLHILAECGAENYGPGKLRIWTLFTHCITCFLLFLFTFFTQVSFGKAAESRHVTRYFKLSSCFPNFFAINSPLLVLLFCIAQHDELDFFQKPEALNNLRKNYIYNISNKFIFMEFSPSIHFIYDPIKGKKASSN